MEEVNELEKIAEEKTITSLIKKIIPPGPELYSFGVGMLCDNIDGFRDKYDINQAEYYLEYFPFMLGFISGVYFANDKNLKLASKLGFISYIGYLFNKNLIEIYLNN